MTNSLPYPIGLRIMILMLYFVPLSVPKFSLTYKDLLQELPITIHNSHHLTSFLHQLSIPPANLPSFAAAVRQNALPLPLFPNLDSLDLSIDPLP